MRTTWWRSSYSPGWSSGCSMWSSTDLLALLLRLERLRIVEHLAVAVPQDVRRVPAVDAEEPGLEPRRDHRLHQRLAGLEVLPGQRSSRRLRQILEGGDVGAEVGRRVRVRHALADGRVRVDHARRDGLVRCLEAALEGLQRPVDRSLLEKDLGAAAPDHHQAVELMIRLEPSNVVDDLLRELALAAARLDVRTVQLLHVVPVEHGRHGRDGLRGPAAAAPAGRAGSPWPCAPLRSRCRRRDPSPRRPGRRARPAGRSP